MSRTLRVLCIVALLSACVQAQVPSVGEVLQHFVSALGGQKELEKIHTMVLRGTITLPELKANGITTEYFEYPDHFAAIIEINGQGTTKLVYDGHEAWQVDPKHGFREVRGDALADLSRRANIHWNLRLREFYPNMQVKGREAVGGQEAWKVEASVGNATYDFLFSAKTGLLLRFDTNQHVPNGISSVLLSDYRQVGKVLFSFGAAKSGGSVKWSRKLTEVRFNVPIEKSVFQKPTNARSN